MSIFTFIPSYSAALTVKHKVREAIFGDGYQQRVADGINNKKRSWSLRFNGPASKIDPIEAFLDNEGGVTSFSWTPPTGLAGLWVCKEWSRTVDGYNREVLSVTFVEVFGE